MKRNKHSDKKIFTEFLSPANFLLRLSDKAYRKYMTNKIYLHALNIRKANKQVYKLFIKKCDVIPAYLQEDCIELLNHYDCWMRQFREEENRRKPLLKDEFIFNRIDDQMAFPRLSEQKIYEAYIKFKNQKNSLT